jgi:hypothetical protein
MTGRATIYTSNKSIEKYTFQFHDAEAQTLLQATLQLLLLSQWWLNTETSIDNLTHNGGRANHLVLFQHLIEPQTENSGEPEVQVLVPEAPVRVRQSKQVLSAGRTNVANDWRQ